MERYTNLGTFTVLPLSCGHKCDRPTTVPSFVRAGKCEEGFTSGFDVSISNGCWPLSRCQTTTVPPLAAVT